MEKKIIKAIEKNTLKPIKNYKKNFGEILKQKTLKTLYKL
jgi:hypothetical protein